MSFNFIAKRLFITASYFFWASLSAQPLQTADRPTLKVGDTFKSEVASNYTGQKQLPDITTVTAVNADTIEFTTNDAKALSTLDLNAIELATSTFAGDVKFFSFPLTVGKKWDFKYSFVNKVTGVRGRQQLEAHVVGVEKIKVPAGEFEAFKIEYKGFWNNDTSGRNGRLLQTTWYAPSVKRSVRVDYDDGFNRNTRELVEYKLN
jgi:hypothetical protein